MDSPFVLEVKPWEPISALFALVVHRFSALAWDFEVWH